MIILSTNAIIKTQLRCHQSKEVVPFQAQSIQLAKSIATDITWNTALKLLLSTLIFWRFCFALLTSIVKLPRSSNPRIQGGIVYGTNHVDSKSETEPNTETIKVQAWVLETPSHPLY